MIEFSEVFDLLSSIRSRTQGIVAAVWDGTQFKVSVARPETGKQVFVMLFDDERDFQRSSSELITEFVAASEHYFSGASVHG